MPALVKQTDLPQLRKAGIADRQPDSEAVEILAKQVAELSAKLSTLGAEQVAAVLAKSTQAQSDALVSALRELTKPQPKPEPAKEKWTFKVTERDKNGRIVAMTADQVR